jgi:hypothetical protein
MPYHPNPTGAQQRVYFLRPEVQRWMRHDAHRWIRHDAARFLPPGMDPADVYPALARQREAEDAAFAAQIAKGYRVLAALREEVAQVKADLVRRRLAQQTKYSPTQPRVPAGNPRGGQWTDRSGGGGTGVGLSQDAGQSQDADLTLPMGDVELGDVSGSSELGDLFQIKPDSPRVEGVQVGGDVIRVCIASGISSWKDGLGIKNYSITYDCAGGPSFRRNYIGNYPGIVRDPYR